MNQLKELNADLEMPLSEVAAISDEERAVGSRDVNGP
jgi:hypothetical protein